MTPFPERPTGGTGPESDISELQKDELTEDDVLNTLDRKNLPPQRREQLEGTLEQLKQSEGALVQEATEEGIRRALQRTDLSPEDREQFEQALQRLTGQGQPQ
ncbi:MAG: hypothetical protein JO092_01435 [Candidatus Eremiobacteraeota bacterium]|nr:hypothetical protein [Candidatus Eremiobacteraeota bacterium]